MSDQSVAASGAALLQRVPGPARATVPITVDGRAVAARAGDTLLTALLTRGDRLADSPFSGAPRAGFCLIGACQDCWVALGDGQRVRACGTLVEPGMAIATRTTPPSGSGG